MAIPGNLTAITVTGHYVYTDGSPGVGTVTFFPTGGVWLKDATAPATVVAKKVTATLDGTGAFSVVLPATDDPDVTPTATTYDVVETIGGVTREYSISLLSTETPVDLATKAPVAPSGSVSQLVVKVNGKLPNGSGEVTLVPGDIGAADATATTNALAGKSATGHTHSIANVTGLQTALDGKATAYTVQALTDSSTLAVDASLGRHFRVTLGGNRTLAAPTNGTDGQMLLVELKQDGTGNRTLALGTGIVLGDDVSTVVLSTGAGKSDYLLMLYNAAQTKWVVLGIMHGYTL
ncbi:hypothetical protein [Actinokineospora globicatena]|uniref:Uncharacterized protein n=1 Tax=Actinokineospora globicatena TaxID=103729 RepID=A0A9W6VA74_9PSEU|nr:hypothetical protein [Actinokineospora globicatena]GLW91776.1 hypothetical protein Aglo03_25920 [Actinokineospora globicatena]